MRRKMKKYKYFLITITTFFLMTLNVLAAGSASLSVNKSTIENGGTVTATASVSNTAAWNIRISSSGATSGCSEKFVGDSGTGNNTTKYFTVTCKATSTGIINFILSGDITSSDGVNTKVSGSKNVTVTLPRTKSSNNKLSSLSVEGFDITPAFSSSINEYNVTVPSTTEKITINAKVADAYASLNGTGEQTVVAGINTFEIVVTSETGVSNTYKLNVNVIDQNPIKVTIDKQNYTVVKEAKNLTKPDLFDETTIKIGEFDIPAFKNEISKYTLVGLKDTQGKIKLFIYDNGKYIKYNEFVSNRISIVFLKISTIPSSFRKENVKINNETISGCKKDNIILLYGLNLENGKKNYYKYDNVEKTIQLFNIDEYEEYENSKNKLIHYIYGLCSISLLLLIIIIILLIKNKKHLKKLADKLKKSND
jgi:hypothetical protein